MTNWTIARRFSRSVDTPKLKGVYLFDKTDNSLVTYLDYIDCMCITRKNGSIADPRN